ncbi:uncharacterized protein MONOS_13517 [Monocercomonoides exilis]|uniref:uncharacterized protein n=1 Tax=Monocercomonoides exilis TaxID=2049356 RepID=UPI00355969AC|nr:hypothetical protein MONOS_13517 [Monocercomonoides exilis]|eukprot:MONOS_13517.1-p1 / transcript=MONOS_13517.1 / gene=MONOS_13517 / organism=Monocercomonoides_exilis_PA203 / gene_product=unspecified product / transcript_product=unspecified product / location=Mono_scaffold00839:978-2425(-) / protein_length=442 / sequence_SO=supercontig / SO=protein_coding / is_pseudo=false
MEMCDEDKSNDDAQDPSLADKFSKLLDQLEHCSEDEQRKKIERMNRLIEEMNKEELKSIINEEIFNKMNKMIEEKKMSMENTFLLLKHVGYCNVQKNDWNQYFFASSLRGRFEQMIAEEEQKKDEKNEKLLTEICECYLYLKDRTISRVPYACVTCLLKAALRKEENKDVQKEAEMALLALSSIGDNFVEQELYLNDIKEIIKYHQEHRNLTHLAYQSAWEFLIKRFIKDRNLEDMIVNELHFVGEAARELEELTRNEDWNRKKGEERGKEAKEEFALTRWLKTCAMYLQSCRLRNEENVGLLKNIVQVHRAEKDNYSIISNLCIYSLRNAAERRVVKVEDLVNIGAIGLFLEGIQRPTLDDRLTFQFLVFFMNVSMRLKRKEKDEIGEVKRKTSMRKVFEKMEEEGFEDTIANFFETIDFLHRKYNRELTLNISDYFVNV